MVNKYRAVTFKETLFPRLMLSVLIVSMFLLALSMQNAMAKEPSNLFAIHYKAQNQYQLKSLQATPKTQIFVSDNIKADNTKMLEDGYDMMGTSGFASADISPNYAQQHGQEIKADIVLVYTTHAPIQTKASRIAFLKKEAEKKGEKLDLAAVQAEEVYDYYASYWVKIPMPTFGVHIVKLKTVTQNNETNEKEKSDVKGLRILAVVKGSAAAKGKVQRGDQLVQIGDMMIDQPKDLFGAVQQYKGQTIPVMVKRQGAEHTLQVSLK